MKNAGIYIHIPFCDHKCIYCDFYSIINHQNTSIYLKALKTEIDYYSNLYSEGRTFTTIFFGGGTPSLMEASYIQEIIKYLYQKFNFTNSVEITLETNPGTVSKEKLIEFYNVGINRISIGIQSFDEEDLKFLTRIHNKEQAIKTVLDAHDAGFSNINIDLIFNLPNQTPIKWVKNLQMAMELPITHLSAYSLILEPGTILNKMVLDGDVKVEDEDYDAALYSTTIEYLAKNNFTQYEVSNFSKSGFECRHNLVYWEHGEYLSFGTSSHSFMENKRWWNVSSLNLYLKSIEEKRNAKISEEVLDHTQLLDEYIMLSLRSKGIDLNRMYNYDASWYERNASLLRELEISGYLTINNNKISLLPSGFAICDEILLKLSS